MSPPQSPEAMTIMPCTCWHHWVPVCEEWRLTPGSCLLSLGPCPDGAWALSRTFIVALWEVALLRLTLLCSIPQTVAQILVSSDGKVRGVGLQDGTEVKSCLVLSNASPQLTFLEMAPKVSSPWHSTEGPLERGPQEEETGSQALLLSLPSFYPKQG